MKAYVELVQRRERELGTDVLTHQKVRILLNGVSVMVILTMRLVEWC
jgi:hypothetical protein